MPAPLLVLHAFELTREEDWVKKESTGTGQRDSGVTCGCEVSYSIFINVTQV